MYASTSQATASPQMPKRPVCSASAGCAVWPASADPCEGLRTRTAIQAPIASGSSTPEARRAPRHPRAAPPDSTVDTGTTTPEARAPAPLRQAVKADVTVATLSLKSRLMTAGSRTFATASAAPMRAVPAQTVAGGPGRDRHTVPAPSARSEARTTADVPNRALSAWASGETTAKAMSGIAASSPSAASVVPRSPAICARSGPTPVIVERRLAAMSRTATNVRRRGRRTAAGCGARTRVPMPGARRPGQPAARASGSRWAIDRVSWNARTPSMPCSRPKPDCFMPPKGARRSSRGAPWSLTQT